MLKDFSPCTCHLTPGPSSCPTHGQKSGDYRADTEKRVARRWRIMQGGKTAPSQVDIDE